eukprot:11315243-Karenia_brevis.AAC.1
MMILVMMVMLMSSLGDDDDVDYDIFVLLFVIFHPMLSPPQSCLHQVKHIASVMMLEIVAVFEFVLLICALLWLRRKRPVMVNQGTQTDQDPTVSAYIPNA